MNDVLGIVGFTLAALLIAAVVAPFESLGWWSGWFGRRGELQRELDDARQTGHLVDDQRAAAGQARPRYYIVFLSGIGSISGDTLLPLEEEFLTDLADRLPAGRVITDVFPYAADGVPLTGQRAFAWMWRRMLAWRLGGGNALTNLVNVRNLFQVLVSADRRFGPVFNYGTSRQIIRGLLRAGYDPSPPSDDASGNRLGDAPPVFLLGSSGGGQISIGAATYLTSSLSSPIEVLSLGGVMASDPGLLRLDHLTHIHGTIDGIQALGPRLFPSRRPAVRQSAWNRALRAGTIDIVPISGIRHQGVGGYLDASTQLDDGCTPRQRTLDTLTDVIDRRLAAHT